ncbi:MAG: High confidence in function and specificity [Pseudomonadota bacterium]|jgi:trans-aconitate 2-methyltransferase
MSWNPAQYLKFAGPRLRPAVDLLARVPIEAPTTVYDLGCGAGQTVALLAARFPGAQVMGVDSSAEMLADARRSFPEHRFVAGDIAAFRAVPPAHLVFSNAALQWLPDHDRLLPRLFGEVRVGGVLAVQVPRVDDSPRMSVLRELAGDPRWAARALPRLQPGPLAPEACYDLLAPAAASLDIWEAEYLHVLEGDDPVVEWTRGAGGAAVLAELEKDEREEFLARYTAAMRAAYPRRKDGTTLLPFRRLFIVAVRK